MRRNDKNTDYLPTDIVRANGNWHSRKSEKEKKKFGKEERTQKLLNMQE